MRNPCKTARTPSGALEIHLPNLGGMAPELNAIPPLGEQGMRGSLYAFVSAIEKYV